MTIKQPSPRLLLSLSILALASPFIQAADNPGVHSHGQAQLQVALEPPRVDVMLVSPAANLVGFEHPPETAAQRETIQSVRDWLGSNPLVNSAGGCRLVESQVTDGFEESVSDSGHPHHQAHGEHHDGHGHHDEHHNDQKNHHDGHAKQHNEHDHDKHHDEHGHASHHGGAEEVQHREFTVSQQLDCEGSMESMNTGLTQRFPGIEQLRVEWLSPTGQGSARLGAGQNGFNTTP